MDRRRAVVVIGCLVGAVALREAAAQAKPAMPVVGFLSNTSAAEWAHLVAAFRQGLKDGGYAEGKNVAIDFRWAEGRYERLPALATELMSRKVAVIATVGGVPPALAAKAATTTIPIVFVIGDDPVRHGLVTSLAHPGKNITGVTLVSVATEAKRFEVLHELVPKARVFGLLVNPDNPQYKLQSREVAAAAQAAGVQLHVLHAANDADFDTCFATIRQMSARGLLVASDAFLNSRRDRIVALADRYSVPTIYPFREFPAAGGLISYGPNLVAAYRDAGVYVAKILNGAKPAELPVSQASKFEMILNLKTAKKLRLAISRDFLARVDEVIE